MVTLDTAAGAALTGTPWQAYPRPRLRRGSYLNLNGSWSLTVRSPEGQVLAETAIRVPFPPESALSGVGRHFPEGAWLCYARTFRLPEDFCRGRVLLHIGAADQETEIRVNGDTVGPVHLGGYDPMTADVTDRLTAGENRLEIRCRDDLRRDWIPHGKQRLRRGGMWYTPVSGIWQTVWMESLPEGGIRQLDVTVTDRQAVLDTGDPAHTGHVTVTAPEGTVTLPLTGGRAVFAPDRPRCWSPEDPYLYRCTVELPGDRVESYFALRQVDIRQVDGVARLCLNGKPYFFHGVLDQGYWSDGLFTPATPECYAQDILAMKAMGFNMLRKHIKVEPERFYYDCDRLGMAVFQDMVSGGRYGFVWDTALPTLGLRRLPDRPDNRRSAVREAFRRDMTAAVTRLRNHPCVCLWTVFNEGWGQSRAGEAYGLLKALDPTRPVDTASGWFAVRQTDVDSRHVYFRRVRLRPGKKPLVLSEFGGISLPVPGHTANPGRTYGYGRCESREELTARLEELYRQQIAPLIPKGLCAAVYTQLSDVEDEVNGLLTYDRRVTKPDPARLRAVARELTGNE